MSREREEREQVKREKSSERRAERQQEQRERAEEREKAEERERAEERDRERAEKETAEREREKRETAESRMNLCLLIYNSKNKIDHIFLSRQNQSHSTGVKKCLFGHTFHMRPKKCSGGVGVGYR